MSNDLFPARSIDVVRHHLADLRTTWRELEPRVRLDPSGVQRLSSLVRQVSVGVAVLEEVAGPTGLRFDLDWLTEVLAADRDSGVLGERLLSELDRQPAEALAPAVRRRIALEVGHRRRRTRIALIRALDSGRYRRLLVAVDALVALRSPAVASSEAREDVSAELTLLAARAHRRGLKAIDRVPKAGPDLVESVEPALPSSEPVLPSSEQAIDQALTAIGRARFAAESAAAGLGRPARRYAARAVKLQGALQKRRDVERLRSDLVVLSGTAAWAPGVAFGYGRLHAGLDRTIDPLATRLAGCRQALTERARDWPGF